CLPPLAWRRRSRRAWSRIGGTGRAAAGPGARPRGGRPGSRCRAGRRRGWGSGSRALPAVAVGPEPVRDASGHLDRLVDGLVGCRFHGQGIDTRALSGRWGGPVPVEGSEALEEPPARSAAAGAVGVAG